ncbi:thiol reductant ABC exporter subunit CydD [Vagococcus zengguangii]|uniref:Thiol reductant ABC exporter subunit CydD n=1 Tax=Vagococcus zengguangii TaxID=2571750 RepID=A0A4D7CRI5_9ENTE|nr:thiol reductant ABC exporter subunit CydD [Vagococcus zengguangii]QCI85623.1 thiol reductant ABC exporter subunit CydD [Vagococcus zengguangii]TLG79574.1 thiol reductant ABC exporter subunit CydD [Vagococcus zengguangii]
MIDKNIFKFEKIRPVFVGLAAYSILQALLIIGQAYFLSKSITNVWSGETVRAQFVNIGIFFGCFMMRQLINFIKDKVLDKYAYEQSRKVRQQLMKKVFSLGPNFVQREGSGNMVTMAIEGISQIENYLTIILPKITNMMIVPWIIALFVFFQNKRSAIILVLVFPVIIIFMIVLGYAARSKADKQYEGFQRLSNHYLDTLRGLETLNLLGLGKRYAKNVFKVSEDYRKATMSTLKIAILSTFALDFFSTLSIALIALLLGIDLIEQRIVLLPALTTLILAPDFFLPVRDFANDYHATLDGGNTLKQIFGILNEEEEGITDNLSLTDWNASSNLTLQNVNVKYASTKDKNTLADINFEWQGYGKIGVVGLSGSGKSTLIKLLGGFLQPADYDKIAVNEHEMKGFREVSWQRQLFYIPQDPYIFHASLAENIKFYVPEASEAEVALAIEQAGLKEVAAELPNGLATIIGEGGHVLSGGQMQRVALARAFLDKNRHILLFDEPTAHLDIETEAELKETILPMFDNKLVFFATHRLHWMREMDYILVMDKGQIVESGTYEELIAKDGAYKQFVNEVTGGGEHV